MRNGCNLVRIPWIFGYNAHSSPKWLVKTGCTNCRSIILQVCNHISFIANVWKSSNTQFIAINRRWQHSHRYCMAIFAHHSDCIVLTGLCCSMHSLSGPACILNNITLTAVLVMLGPHLYQNCYGCYWKRRQDTVVEYRDVYCTGWAKKLDCFLKLWNYCMYWHTIAFYIPNCSVFYPE